MLTVSTLAEYLIEPAWFQFPVTGFCDASLW